MAASDSAPRVALAMDLDRVEALSDDLERMAEGHEAAALMRALVAMFKARVPHYHWVGIYLLEDGVLRLGPYAGAPSPHARIAVGEGICGAAAQQHTSIIVPDVHADPRYLACALSTRSEIVVPIIEAGRVLGEIDIDSDRPDAFNEHDQALLERAASLIGGALRRASPRPRWAEPEAVAG